MTDDAITIAIDEGVMILTLNRPAKKNALTTEMYRVLAEALQEAETDPTIRAVLLRGEGQCFTAGNDLADFAAVAAGAEKKPYSQQYIHALSVAEKPLVAAVTGIAVGIGVTMLLHCDLIYAAEDAKLSTPFVNLALIPEAGSTRLLQQRIGYARAFQMFALGEAVSGTQAAAIGLVNAALPAAEVDAAALAAAKTLARKPLGSLKATKKLMRDAEAILDKVAAENVIFGARLRTAEAAEAFQAFAERRAPDFTGLDGQSR